MRTLWMCLATAVLLTSSTSCSKKNPVKPSTPRPPTHGRLVVLSTPPNAPVYLDGYDTRKATPAVLDSLGTGDHTILLRRGGYDDWTTTVRVCVGVTDTVRSVLVPASASVALSSEPDGAQIWRGNVNTGKLTPDSLVKLEAGPVHTIRLIKQYFQPWDTMLTVEPQSRRGIHVVLRYRPDAPGKLAVSSEPSGASIYLDGVSQNRVTPYTLETVATGSHTLGLRLTGYRNWDQSVTVNPGMTTTVHSVLERRQGRLSVSSTPDSALLWLDGVSTSRRTPVMIDSLIPKTYAVKLTRTNYRDWTQNVTVLDGQTATVSATLQVACPGDIVGNLNEAPAIRITVAEAGRIRGEARNIVARLIRVVLWALTDKWYVQPYIDSPYTVICGDGSWSNYTHPWNRIVALLVDETYVPGATRTYHPKNDPGVLAWAEYPSTRNDLPLQFSGRTWDIKVAEAPFGPGPNFFSDHPDNVFVDQTGRLHLKIVYRDGKWYCSEVLLPQSLGNGVYTVQIDSRLDGLDQNIVVAPEFTFESETRELDFEAAGDVLIPGANNGQFVVQPYTRAGNLVRFIMPPDAQTSCRIEWRADHVRFTVWKGHSAFPPAAEDVIYDWNYTGPDIPPPGGERLHANIWLFGGRAPTNGQGAEVIIKSITFTP